MKIPHKEHKMSYLNRYFEVTAKKDQNSAAIAYLAVLDHLNEKNQEVACAILQELKDQRTYLKMIASENYSSFACQLAMGNLLTDKYSEGYPGHRFYPGCENVDRIESLAIEELKTLFGAEHAYVQPHSGADANLVAFWSILVHRIQNKELLKLGEKTIDTLSSEEFERIRKLMGSQKIMGLSLSSGGHLTHGYRHNVSAKMFQSVSYDVDPQTEMIDYKILEKRVKEEKPLILIGGYSAYPRLMNFAKMREIAETTGAILMVDMAHFSGLVAGKAITGEYDPIPYAHIVTSTTHKTMRGPRGGMILCKEEYREIVDKGCPLVLGGPLPHVIAAKVVAFREANQLNFRTYAKQVIKNGKALAGHLLKKKLKLFTQGTENHLVVIDVMKSFSLTGRQAETAMREAFMTVNRNMIPFDVNGPWYTSGIRIGTAALTSLGMKEEEMKTIAQLIIDLLKASKGGIIKRTGKPSKAKVKMDLSVLQKVQTEVGLLIEKFPLYPELTFLEELPKH